LYATFGGVGGAALVDKPSAMAVTPERIQRDGQWERGCETFHAKRYRAAVLRRAEDEEHVWGRASAMRGNYTRRVMAASVCLRRDTEFWIVVRGGRREGQFGLAAGVQNSARRLNF